MARKTATQSLAEYAFARLAAAGIGAFPLDANLRTAAWLARAVEPLDARHRGLSERHIRLAFPDWPAERVRACHRASLEHLVRLAMEVVQTPRLLGPGTWRDHVDLVNMDRAMEVLRAGPAGGPCLLVTGHVGNWELLGRVVALLGLPIRAVYRPLDNPRLDGWVRATRARQGLGLIPKGGGVPAIQRALDAGSHVAVVADHNAGDRGLFVPCFGRLASAHRSVALLAVRRRLPIVCGYAHRTGPGPRYEVGVADLILPEHWAHRPDPGYYLTARCVRALEAVVRRRPAQNLWMHRRWKSRPPWERAGEPAPPEARERLRALPWLTDADVDGLLAAPPP